MEGQRRLNRSLQRASIRRKAYKYAAWAASCQMYSCGWLVSSFLNMRQANLVVAAMKMKKRYLVKQCWLSYYYYSTTSMNSGVFSFHFLSDIPNTYSPYRCTIRNTQWGNYPFSPPWFTQCHCACITELPVTLSMIDGRLILIVYSWRLQTRLVAELLQLFMWRIFRHLYFEVVV